MVPVGLSVCLFEGLLLVFFCLVLPFILVSFAVVAASSIGTVHEMVGTQGLLPARGSLGERMRIF